MDGWSLFLSKKYMNQTLVCQINTVKESINIYETVNKVIYAVKIQVMFSPCFKHNTAVIIWSVPPLFCFDWSREKKIQSGAKGSQTVLF